MSDAILSFLWKGTDKKRVISVSENISLLGYLPDDFVSGKLSFMDIIHPSDIETVRHKYVQYTNNKSPFFVADYRLRSADGKICEVSERTVELSLDDECLYHGIISIKKSFEFDTDKEKIYCKSIVDGIQNPLLILDSTFHVFSANRYFYDLFKLKPENTEGKHFLSLNNSNRHELSSFFDKVLQEEYFFDSIEVDCSIDGLGNRTMKLTARPLDTGMDRKKLILVSIEDITPQKMAEAKIRASEEKYSTLVEKGNDGILIVNQKGTLSFANSKFSQMIGLEQNKLSGKNLLDFVPQEYHRMIGIRLKKVLKDMRSIKRNDEVEFIKTEGGSFSAEISLSYILHEHQPSVMVALRDISERKHAEAELKASEEKYSTLVEKGNDGIIILHDLSFKFANSKFSELTGYSREELLDKTFTDLVPVDYRRMIGKRIKKVLKDKHSIRRNDELEFLAKGDVTFPAEISLSYILHEEMPSVMMTVRDISERKQAEAELKASEKKYSSLVEEGNDGIIIVQNGVLVFANMKFCEITGFSKTEILRRPFEDFLSIEYKRLVMTKFRKSLEKKKSSLKYEIELVSKEGHNTPAEINSSIIDHEGAPAIMAIIRDITDQKEKERELLELIEVQKVLETVIKSSPAVVFFWKPDEDWKVEFVSENISQFGYQAEDMMSGKILYGDIIHPSDVERLTMEYDIFSGEENLSFEYRILTKAGEVRWVDERSVLKRDAEGNLQYIQGIIVDITERKNVKNFMQIGNDVGMLFSPLGDVGDMFSQLVEFTTQMDNLDCGALYLVDGETGDMNIVAHSGLSAEFVKSARHYGGKSIHARLLKTEYPLYTRYYELTSMIPGEKLSYEGLEATALIPIRYGMELVAILMLSSHSVYSVPFEVRDSLETVASQIGPVIGRMREQADVQKNIRNLQVIFDVMEDMVFMLDADGCILYANPYTFTRLGYSKNELIGMNLINLYPQKVLLEVATEIKSLLEGRAKVCTIPFESVSGELVTVEMHCSTGQLGDDPITICVSREKGMI
ncbi:PAS domain S-box protein [Methanolobus sediminis]|uniref:histidine kinase n=1 Tax=Methanolobus sediminis TaxID=3072978 RepID=A0AA51UK22_9EURY|nr:PAS domain S-box protein [Methanolobus sediminis]WMW24996.1 PAS domain S-box protein [Methanolobus sediminis]